MIKFYTIFILIWLILGLIGHGISFSWWTIKFPSDKFKRI